MSGKLWPASRRERLACAWCGGPYWRRLRSRTSTCSDACRRHLQAESAKRAHALRYPTETPESIEAAWARVRAERLAEERRTGQRRYTIGDGWEQRPGSTDWMDADGQPSGWRR